MSFKQVPLNYVARFGYAVQDDEGNDFNQQEQSDGNTVGRNKRTFHTLVRNKTTFGTRTSLCRIFTPK